VVKKLWGKNPINPSISYQFNPQTNHGKFDALLIASNLRGGKGSYEFQLLCRMPVTRVKILDK